MQFAIKPGMQAKDCPRCQYIVAHLYKEKDQPNAGWRCANCIKEERYGNQILRSMICCVCGVKQYRYHFECTTDDDWTCFSCKKQD